MKKNQIFKNWNIPSGNDVAKAHTRYAPIISAVVAAFCIIIYLTAVVQATVRVYLSIEKSKAIADREFSAVAETAFSVGMYGFMDENYIEAMNNALARTTRLEALIISGPDGEYAFEKQKDYAVAWVDNSPRFLKKFNFSNQNYYRPLPLRDLRGANIRAVANAFEYDEFLNVLKQTLFIIMIGFTISFLTMLLQLLLKKQDPEHVQITSSEPDSFTTDEFETVIPATGPKGLYSPRSGIGWEEYIKDRLDSELHRCSSTENDLVLVLLEFTDLTNDNMYKQSAEEAISILSSRDLLFEYGQWGFAAILPGITLELAITKSENYFQYIMKKFPRGYDNTSGIYIGLTSRSGRLLNAGRLTLEAKEALKKAKTDPKTPIVAFKSDPEKYRDFIRKNS